MEKAAASVKPDTSLKGRVVRGGFWVFLLRFSNRGLGLISTAVLARLLAPEDFGLLGLAFLCTSTLETFSQTGFQQALVQKKNDSRELLDTTWTISVIRGVLLCLLLWFAAPAISAFFNSPRAVWIIRAISLRTVLTGTRNIAVVYFQKELDFRKGFVFEFIPRITGVVVSIVLAFQLRSVWALALGRLTGGTMAFLLSYLLHPYRPSFRIGKEQLQELFGFGKWVFFSSILVFLNSQGDDILVGKMLGAAALGLYQMAYTWSNLPATEISLMVSRVTFPAFAKLQDQAKNAGIAYLKVLKLISFVSIPVGAAIFLVAGEITEIVLGTKWLAIVPAMEILVLWGIIRSVGATTGPLLIGLGRPDLPTKLQFLQSLIMFSIIYPLCKTMGIRGASLAALAGSILPNLIALGIAAKHTQCGIGRMSRDVLFPFFAAIVAVFSGKYLLSLIGEWTAWQRFILSLGVFGCVYFLMSLLLDRMAGYQIVRFLRNVRSEPGST